MDNSQKGFQALKNGGNMGGDPLSVEIESKPTNDAVGCIAVSEVRDAGPHSEVAEMKNVDKGFTRRQWFTLILFGVVNLIAGMIFSIQAPFYPREAEIKGATATEYGLVFGIYALTNFLSAPIFGKYMNRLGPRLVFNSGLFLTSISCISFGLLDGLNDHTMFITLSFILRITEALGATAVIISSFTIIAYEFPDNVATTFATLETGFGFGLIAGPSVGGVLFELRGYILPFAVTGACILILGVLSSFIMPEFKTVSDNDGNTDQGYGIFTIFKIPSVFLSVLCVAFASGNLEFLSVILEPYLRRFNLSPTQIGLMFVINSGIYAISAPLLGRIIDKYSIKPLYISMLGCLLISVAFLGIGPAAFIPLHSTLWLTGVSLVIFGIGHACCYVAGFIGPLQDSLEYGLPDNITTYSVVSGLWFSALSLGSFIGSSIGGFLFDYVGLRNSTYFPLLSMIILLILLISYRTMKSKIKPKLVQTNTESTLPLDQILSFRTSSEIF